jgi:predicted nuclease of predicted toxin-antitoxin system
MRFVADEGLDAPIVSALRSEGHEVFYIKEEHPGLSDDEVLKVANERGDILITSDKDFGELVYRLKQIHSGIILIRLSGIKPNEKAVIISTAIKEHGIDLHHAFAVINKTHVKIRK